MQGIGDLVDRQAGITQVALDVGLDAVAQRRAVRKIGGGAGTFQQRVAQQARDRLADCRRRVRSAGGNLVEGAAWELRGNDLIRRVYLGEAIAD